jgi:hypothetical protein
MQFWYYLGLELALGSPADRAVTRWDEMFVPMVVADEIAAMSQAAKEAGNPLISVDTMLFTSPVPLPPETPDAVWYRYLLLGLLITGLAWLSGKFMPPAWLEALCQAWVLICTTNGLILAAMWLFTDHEVARANANLLLFNPLVILGLVSVLRRVGAVVMAGGVAVAYLLLLFPGHQYNLDVLALLTPVNLAVAGFLMFRRR